MIVAGFAFGTRINNNNNMDFSKSYVMVAERLDLARLGVAVQQLDHVAATNRDFLNDTLNKSQISQIE